MNSKAGFTRVELMAIAAVGSLLFFVAAPAVGSTRSEANAIGCLDNHRKLIQAWLAFGADNNDILTGSVHGGAAASPTPFTGTVNLPWATGWLDWDLSSHNTNTTYLIDPAYATLANYVNKDSRVFRCPADNFVSRSQRLVNWTARVRSYAMNASVGVSNAESGPFNALYRRTTRLSEMVNPAPSMVFVFVDENADSMNDTLFFGPSGTPPQLSLVDVPANYHDEGATLSFADGRSEIHRWTGALRISKVTTVGVLLPNSPSTTDARYLFDHSPRNNP